MPFMRSESCSFIWHPKVVTWKVFTALTAAEGTAAARQAANDRAAGDVAAGYVRAAGPDGRRRGSGPPQAS